MTKRIIISRPDGRSNQQVLIDFVHAAEPGMIFTYDQLMAHLTEGGTHSFTRQEVQQVARVAGTRLLREHQRALLNLTNVGYKLAHANEHTKLAIVRRRRGDSQFKRGYALLKEVRWDELEPNSRKLHEAQLLIVSAMYEQMRSFERRVSQVEDSIKRITGGHGADPTDT